MRSPHFTLLCLAFLPLAARADDIVTIAIQGTETASYTYVNQDDPNDPDPHTITRAPVDVNGTATLDLTTSTLSGYTSVPTLIRYSRNYTDTITLPISVSQDCSYDPSSYSVSLACFSGDGSSGSLLVYDALPASLTVGGDNTLGRITYELDATFAPQAVSSIAPEPSSFVLLGTGFLGIAGALRRRYA